MTGRASLLERSYQLAISGKYSDIALLVRQLAQEGYPTNDIRSLFKGDKFREALEKVRKEYFKG